MTILRQDLTFPFSTAMLIPSEHVQKALTLSNQQFKRLFGVKRQTFNQMLEILPSAFDKLYQHGGKPLTKLRVEDRERLTCSALRTIGVKPKRATGQSSAKQ
jgi:hypothetical protein